MKKIIFTILILFFGVTIVSAKTYYSPYQAFGDYQIEPILANDRQEVEIERRYQRYQLNRIYGEYLPMDQTSSEYPMIDESDTIMSPWTEWENGVLTATNDQLIETRTIYQYDKLDKVSFIHFSNVVGSNNYFKLTEIQVLIDGVSIPYTMPCPDCTGNYVEQLQNGITEENPVMIPNGSYFRIYLIQCYDLSDLTIKLSIVDDHNEKVEFLMQANNYFSPYYPMYTSDQKTVAIDHQGVTEVSYHGNDLTLYEPLFVETFTSLEKVEVEGRYQIIEIPQFRFQKKWYHRYREEKKYDIDYHKLSNEKYPILDLERYQDYYRVRSREKLVLKDQLVLANMDDPFEDWIVESTSPVTISTSLDRTKNGIYDAIFCFTDQCVTESVIVMIPENDIREEQQQILDLIKENERLQKLLEEKNKLISSLEEQVKWLTDEKDAYLGKVEESIKRIDQLNQTVTDQATAQEELNQKYQNEINMLESTLLEKNHQNEELEKQLTNKTTCSKQLSNPFLDLTQHPFQLGATIAVILCVLLLFVLYIMKHRQKKSN